MRLSDFRIGWRQLVQQPAYTAVVLCGLALGFAACFLLLGYVRYCLDYDSQVPQRERVFAVTQRINVFPRPDWQNYAFLSVQRDAQRSGMVEASTIVRDVEQPVRHGGRLSRLNLRMVDGDFADIFGVAALQGDLRATLASPDGVALTRSAAARLFGSAPPLGRVLHVDGKALQVRAILPDHPANTSIPYEALVGSASVLWPAAQRAQAYEGNGRATLYLKLNRGADAATLTRLLQQALNDTPHERQARASAMGRSLGERNVTDIALLPLAQLYFDPGLATGRNAGQHGQRATVYGLAALALLILALAAINYVNLTTVRMLRRQREIALRKVLGAGTGPLVRQFLAESVLVALLAVVAGLLLAWLALPLLSELVQRPLAGIFTPQHCAAMLLAALLTGMLAGAYPAWCALGIWPGLALAGRGNAERGSGRWLRRALTVAQFAAAIALGATTLAVGWQTWYASTASPGFDPAGLLVLDLPPDLSDASRQQARAFQRALERLPGIQGVASISDAVGRDGLKMIGSLTTRDGRDVRLEYKSVSASWFSQHQLHPVSGRLFDPDQDREDSKAVVLNAAAARLLGFATPYEAVGKLARDGSTIIGIAPEIRFQSMRQAGGPIMYRLEQQNVLTIRSSTSAAQLYHAIEPLWRQHFPDQIMELHTEAGLLGAQYDQDRRLAIILAVGSALAIVLAAFGIYVLSASSVQRQERQIVMRKLHGAGKGAIARLVGREFALLVGMGALLGLPLAAAAIQRYLDGFVERAPAGHWSLAAALLLAMLVALLATARHTLAALRLSPALALRD
ncbi:ABC transporter permease [Oxalobacteraceae bacterium A2-2]